MCERTGQITRRRLVINGAKAAAGLVAAAGLNHPRVAKAESGVNCAIEMFHHVSQELVEGELKRYLDAGVLPISMHTLGRLLIGQQVYDGRRLVCFTYDDGYADQIGAIRAHRKYNAPGTLFVMGTGWHGDGVHAYLSEDEIKKASEVLEIGSHTINHDPNLIALRQRDEGAYKAELVESKQQLEYLIGGKPVTSFSSPDSVYNDQIRSDVRAAGYTLAVMTAGDQKSVQYQHKTEDLLMLPRHRLS